MIALSLFLSIGAVLFSNNFSALPVIKDPLNKSGST